MYKYILMLNFVTPNIEPNFQKVNKTRKMLNISMNTLLRGTHDDSHIK